MNIKRLREKFGNDALLYFIIGMVGTVVVILTWVGYKILFGD